jgi:hypothetical protein
MHSLLAVDVGLKTGTALYGKNGKLCWYRSKNYGAAINLKRGAHTLLKEMPDLSYLVLEGGGQLADIWHREANRLTIPVIRVSAEQWRSTLLYPREQLTGLQAKHYADARARKVIEWSGTARPTSLRHDTAEAILIGLWAVLEIGWLENLPHELKR